MTVGTEIGVPDLVEVTVGRPTVPVRAEDVHGVLMGNGLMLVLIVGGAVAGLGAVIKVVCDVAVVS
jgi:hypothetical protein